MVVHGKAPRAKVMLAHSKNRKGGKNKHHRNKRHKNKRYKNKKHRRGKKCIIS